MMMCEHGFITRELKFCILLCLVLCVSCSHSKKVVDNDTVRLTIRLHNIKNENISIQDIFVENLIQYSFNCIKRDSILVLNAEMDFSKYVIVRDGDINSMNVSIRRYNRIIEVNGYIDYQIVVSKSCFNLMSDRAVQKMVLSIEDVNFLLEKKNNRAFFITLIAE